MVTEVTINRRRNRKAAETMTTNGRRIVQHGGTMVQRTTAPSRTSRASRSTGSGSSQQGATRGSPASIGGGRRGPRVAAVER